MSAERSENGWTRKELETQLAIQQRKLEEREDAVARSREIIKSIEIEMGTLHVKAESQCAI